MENPIECPKLKNCPIFKSGVLMNELTGESYRKIYCLKQNYKTCKRFLTSKICSKPIPIQVLPNSFLSPEEIAEKIIGGYWQQ